MTQQEDIQFLKDLQNELKTQDNDGQATPRFWTIGDYEMTPCPDGFEKEMHVVLPTRDYHGKLDELIDNLKEEVTAENGYTEEAIEEFNDIQDDISALEWLQEHYDDGAELVPMKENFIVRPDTFFLTKTEAKRHLELNHYHYSSKAHTYAMTAWRAPKVERLWSLLEAMDWDTLETRKNDTLC